MQFGSRYLHKHLHPIYIKHAHISQLLDFVAIQQLRDVCLCRSHSEAKYSGARIGFHRCASIV